MKGCKEIAVLILETDVVLKTQGTTLSGNLDFLTSEPRSRHSKKVLAAA